MLVRDLFNKKLKDLTLEEKREYERRLYDRKRKGTWDKSYCRIVYGKKLKDLTLEERRKYNKEIKKQPENGRIWKKACCHTIYNKSYKSLSPEEKREFDRMMQREYRKRQKEKISKYNNLCERYNNLCERYNYMCELLSTFDYDKNDKKTTKQFVFELLTFVSNKEIWENERDNEKDESRTI